LPTLRLNRAWTKAAHPSGNPRVAGSPRGADPGHQRGCRSLLEMGVKGVVVKDFHRTGYNLILPAWTPESRSFRYLHRPAPLWRSSWCRFRPLCGSARRRRNEKGFLPTPWTSRLAEIRVNGARSVSRSSSRRCSPISTFLLFFSRVPGRACRKSQRK